MSGKGIVTLPTLRAVRRLAANGGVFQSQGLREQLGYPEGSQEAHNMHSVVNRLKKSGIIAPVNDSRRRNQYLRLVDEDLLRRQIERAATPSDTNGAPGAPGPIASPPPTSPVPDAEESRPSAPRRVMHLEERVADLEARLSALSGLPALVGKLQSEFEETNEKLDRLIELWS